MKRRKLDLIGLSETHEKESPKERIHEGNLLIGSGTTSGRHGVAIVISEELSHLVGKFEQIDNRVVKVCFKTGTPICRTMTDKL